MSPLQIIYRHSLLPWSYRSPYPLTIYTPLSSKPLIKYVYYEQKSLLIWKESPKCRGKGSQLLTYGLWSFLFDKNFWPHPVCQPLDSSVFFRLPLLPFPPSGTWWPKSRLCQVTDTKVVDPRKTGLGVQTKIPTITVSESTKSKEKKSCQHRTGGINENGHKAPESKNVHGRESPMVRDEDSIDFRNLIGTCVLFLYSTTFYL